jgi:hypothetical protein
MIQPFGSKHKATVRGKILEKRAAEPAAQAFTRERVPVPCRYGGGA